MPSSFPQNVQSQVQSLFEKGWGWTEGIHLEDENKPNVSNRSKRWSMGLYQRSGSG